MIYQKHDLILPQKIIVFDEKNFLCLLLQARSIKNRFMPWLYFKISRRKLWVMKRLQTSILTVFIYIKN